MRHSTGAKLIAFTMVFAVSMATNRSVQAGKPWGWQKSANEKLGGFYTSNKAFKRPKTTSRSYRQHSSHYSSQSVNPTYSQPIIQRVIVHPTSAAVPTPPAVTTAPTRVTPLQAPPVRTIRGEIAQGEIAQAQAPRMMVNGNPASEPRPVTTPNAPKPNIVREIQPSKAAPDTALGVAEAALKVLNVEQSDVGTKRAGLTEPTRVNKGAIRLESPQAVEHAEPLPFRSTTDKFWE